MVRKISVWAYHNELLPVCRNTQLDSSTGLSYPQGNKQGQVGWNVAVPYQNLQNLVGKFKKGIAMPRQFCGNWFFDCDPIKPGEIVRLALSSHGDQGGKIYINGRKSPPMTAKTVKDYHSFLHDIGLMTNSGSYIFLMACLAGQGEEGTRLLQGLSKVWPDRYVVGFSTLGYRHGGEMKKIGTSCMAPGMRNTEATSEIFRNDEKWNKQWSYFATMPWASESSPYAKIVWNDYVIRYPILD